MKVYNFKEKINDNELIECANALKEGKLVIFPTETVYGIGANALLSDSVDSIFKAKGRANDNPLIVHISDFDMLKDLVYEPNEIERKLMDAFMPGPFTIILKKKDIIPANVSANLDTVGIRMPDNKIAYELIKKAAVPVAAPSANISSRPSGTNIEDIKDEFDGKVDYIIDGGDTKIGVESTVLKVIDNIPTILRPGAITPNDIRNLIGVVKVDDHILKDISGPVLSPGMKYKHYAPNHKSILVYNEDDSILKEIVNKYATSKTVIIGSSKLENINSLKFLNYGNTLDEISSNIFKLLRQADKYDADLIIIEGVSKEDLGLAIMNRLIRATNFNYIDKL